MRPVLALFVRALRQATRAPSTYLLRSLVALVVLLFLWNAQSSLSWSGAVGRRFFGILVATNYFFVTLIGLGSFASAIAEEKEEGTLGLLRMTDLSPLALLFGKSTSRLGVLLLLLLVQVPFAFLAVTLGGVSQTQILFAYTLLATYLFALANVSLFFSVRLSGSNHAAFFTLAVIITYSLLCGGPDLLASWLIEKRYYSEIDPTISALRSVSEGFWSVHPLNHCVVLASTGFLSLELARSVMVHLGSGIAFFIFSLLIFERYCGDESAYSQPGGALRSIWRWFGRPKRTVKHAVCWKDFHFTLGGRFSIILRCFLYGLCVVLVTWSNEAFVSKERLSEVSWHLGIGMLHVELALYALMIWGHEAWGQNIGALVATPRALRWIHLEKLRAILISLTPSAALFLAAVLINSEGMLNLAFLSWLRPAYPLEIRARMLLSLIVWVVEFGTLLILIMNLSLRMKWTALPAAIGIFVLFQLGVLMSFNLLRSPSISYGTQMMIRSAIILIFLFPVVVFLVRDTNALLLRRASEG